MLSLDSQNQLEAELVGQAIVSRDKLGQIKQAAIENDKPLVTELLDRGTLSEEALTKLMAGISKVGYVNLSESEADPEALKLLPREIAERYMAVPIGEVDGRLAMAMLDPSNVQTVDFLTSKTGRQLLVFMASQSGIERIFNSYRGDLQVENLAEHDEEPSEVTDDDPEKVKTIVQDSPITRTLKAILDYAVQADASDIHIEPTQNNVKIRCRVDGLLHEVMTLPKSSEPALVSRVKILSSLKIDEHRLTQDGQFHFSSAGKEIDVRVATSPVVWGEQVVLRLLVKDDQLTTLESLGFGGRDLTLLREGIRKPYGMILSSGPTGSGKSTTLYAMINEIKNSTINVVTLEDPVERKIDGINQIQVNPNIGLTFASGLRSVLRQDPDVVMVGEIRDKETATLAVQAALTGHLVLSTLHTNTAAGVLPRLLDMGIEPFLIAATVKTVIGQRLVRRVCADHTTYQSSKSETEALHKTLEGILPAAKAEVKAKQQLYGLENLPLIGDNAYTLYQGTESKACPGGYKGRMGIYEVFSVTDKIQNMITGNISATDIKAQVERDGMTSMLQNGYLKALNGHTTLSEVARVAADY